MASLLTPKRKYLIGNRRGTDEVIRLIVFLSKVKTGEIPEDEGQRGAGISAAAEGGISGWVSIAVSGSG
ncbi:MAG: hypothetical protein UX17_C0019G0001, partial [Parcubacteria group bacterium GW2011_GWC2_45_7]